MLPTVIVRVAVKPTSSIEREQDTVTKNLDPEKIIVYCDCSRRSAPMY